MKTLVRKGRSSHRTLDCRARAQCCKVCRLGRGVLRVRFVVWVTNAVSSLVFATLRCSPGSPVEPGLRSWDLSRPPSQHRMETSCKSFCIFRNYESNPNMGFTRLSTSQSHLVPSLHYSLTPQDGLVHYLYGICQGPHVHCRSSW